ncbi:beta-ketoacyl synthase chain length factor [Rhodobacteraceae bacterium NNCM2]|nr:beta-ketoacyl synthase chain length factor [Coraliihabitans acroporae]
MRPLQLCLDRVTFAAPGIDDWEGLRGVIAGAARGDDWQVKPSCLPPRAMRRFSPQILLALTMAERVAPVLPAEAGWVFASSIGEGETLQIILEALREPGMMVQPFRFQNSVHNAPSGQWTIAAGLHGPTTSIGAYDETVGAGFLKAAMQVVLEARPVGLVFYDVPLPEPLNGVHPIGEPIGAGFALRPEPGAETIAVIEVSAATGPSTAAHSTIGRELMATGNPIADVMPLLECLAGGGAGDVLIDLHGGGALRLAVRPV